MAEKAIVGEQWHIYMYVIPLRVYGKYTQGGYDNFRGKAKLS